MTTRFMATRFMTTRFMITDNKGYDEKQKVYEKKDLWQTKVREI